MRSDGHSLRESDFHAWEPTSFCLKNATGRKRVGATNTYVALFRMVSLRNFFDLFR